MSVTEAMEIINVKDIDLQKKKEILERNLAFTKDLKGSLENLSSKYNKDLKFCLLGEGLAISIISRLHSIGGISLSTEVEGQLAKVEFKGQQVSFEELLDYLFGK